jgi:hypothetical protein
MVAVRAPNWVGRHTRWQTAHKNNSNFFVSVTLKIRQTQQKGCTNDRVRQYLSQYLRLLSAVGWGVSLMVFFDCGRGAQIRSPWWVILCGGAWHFWLPSMQIAACNHYGAQDFGVALRFLETLGAPDLRRQFPVTNSKDATVCFKTSCFQLETTSEGKHLKYLLANNDCQEPAICVCGHPASLQ